MNVKKHSMGEWVLATRPWSFPASAMPVMVTMVWLWSRGVEVRWWLGVLSLLNIVLVHAAGNVWSDIADYRHGVDAEDTFGTRLLVDEQFSPDEFRRLSLVLNVAAVVLGLVMVGLTGWPLLVIGVAGLLLSLCYPWLKYAALGDVVIILCYALLPMLGTSYIVSGEVRPEVLWLALPVGLITVAILHINNVRDVTTDRRAGISTLPLLTGTRVGTYIYMVEVLLPFVWIVGLVALGIGSWGLLASLLALPLAVKNVRTMFAGADLRESCAHLDEGTAQLQLAFSLCLMLGLIVNTLIK